MRCESAPSAKSDQFKELAYDIARLPNPFPSICGRVCAAPCEIACRRGGIDEPIAIRALKQFVCERHGVAYVQEPVTRRFAKMARVFVGTARMRRVERPAPIARAIAR